MSILIIINWGFGSPGLALLRLTIKVDITAFLGIGETFGVDSVFMKVVMINDCAYVGETLLKYLPSDMEKRHIKRTRGFWSKTFGLAYAVLRAKADVYHVHYLLQDCYIASRLGKKPLVGHAHGSDLRSSLHHPLWGRVVRHNLKNCDKILVSTPDVLNIARRFREDAEYLPNPVDADLFYVKPAAKHDGKIRVLIGSDSNWVVKGTDVAIKALSAIKDTVDVSIVAYGADFEKTLHLASCLGLPLRVLPKVPHDRLNEYYWSADVVIDRFKLGSMGMISLEAIACGRPVITYVSSEYHEHDDFPMLDVDTIDKVVSAFTISRDDLWIKEHEYILKRHSPQRASHVVVEIYDKLLAR
jgi:glycosyltransferase involved in cell wall biosynthesis